MAVIFFTHLSERQNGRERPFQPLIHSPKWSQQLGLRLAPNSDSPRRVAEAQVLIFHDPGTWTLSNTQISILIWDRSVCQNAARAHLQFYILNNSGSRNIY